MIESLFSLACYFPPAVVLYLNSILELCLPTVVVGLK
jgi:hypothetical protein